MIITHELQQAHAEIKRLRTLNAEMRQTLSHALEAIEWHQAEAFEMDDIQIGERIIKTLAKSEAAA